MWEATVSLTDPWSLIPVFTPYFSDVKGEAGSSSLLKRLQEG
jgi:hypothetical protein